MRYFLFIILLLTVLHMKAQTVIPLYPDKIPNSKKSSNQEKLDNSKGYSLVRKVSVPTLTIYLPKEKQPATAAVIICPGGGYWVNAIKHEGTDVAEQLAAKGIAAFVLKYRIPESRIMIEPEIGPLQDAQQAIKIVRENAARWNVDPRRVGILGFSAGGHVASTAGIRFKTPVIENKMKVNLRPDFMILIYPVISFQDSIGHLGSREKLIGKTPTEEKIKYYSNELQITAQTPPTFLVHAKDDKNVMAENSIRFYKNLKKHNVPAELYLFEEGGHGFGLINPEEDERWLDHCFTWMRSQKFIP